MRDYETWYAACLVVSSQTLSARRIAEVLGTQGSDQIERGTPLIAFGRALSMNKESGWILNATGGPSDSAEGQVEELLDFVESKAGELASIVADCRIRLSVSFWTQSGQGGFRLEPPMLRRFGELRVTLDVSSLLCEDDG